MAVDRRLVLKSALAVSAATALPRWAAAGQGFIRSPGDWRTFETVIRMQIAEPEGKVQAWIPLPAVTQDAWIRAGDSTWTAEGGEAVVVVEARFGAKMLHVVWPDGTPAPVVTVTSRFEARDRAIDLSRPGNVAPLTASERALYTQGTELLPIDGVVKEAADKITADIDSDLGKAKALYGWVVENTFRNPETRGCGLGDITYMLKSGDLSGKCADINALYVGLARSIGLPARDVYGIRVAASRFGYKSLGPSTEIVTKAQHCRAEVHLEGFGWVPVDPGDVRKVVLEEPPGNLARDHAKVTAAQKTLFGAWEGNWLAYNFAHDVALPGSSGPKLAFLMYPQAETKAGRLDCLDPDNVSYTVKAREIVS